MFSGVVKGVEQIPNTCNFFPVTDSPWKRRRSVRQWVHFLGNLSSLRISLACTKAKWSHSRAFLCIPPCAQNTRSRVTRKKFWKRKFQNGKDLSSHFSLDITPPSQHWDNSNVIFCVCETNLLVALPTHKAMSIIWSLGDGDKSDRIPTRLVPSHGDESQYNPCGKTETWKTRAAPWKSRDTFSLANRTMHSFLENRSLKKREDLNLKSSWNNKGTAVQERNHTKAGRQESTYKPSWVRKQCRCANKHWKPFIHKYQRRKTLSRFLAVSKVLGQELK